MSGFSPIRGKCFYWREQVNEDDRYDPRLKSDQWRVLCSCFVEGDQWTFPASEVPGDCPERMRCRYYIHFG